MRVSCLRFCFSKRFFSRKGRYIAILLVVVVVAGLLLFVKNSISSLLGTRAVEAVPYNEKAAKNIIVLLHGIRGRNDIKMRKLKVLLEKAFHQQAVVLILKRPHSAETPILQQVDNTYLDLKTQLAVLGLSQQNIIFVGDSQGAFVALQLYDKYPAGIAGIVINHAPLCGFNIYGFRKFKEDLALLQQKIERNHRYYYLGYKFIKEEINNTATKFNFDLAGVRDMCAGSNCLKKIQLILEKSNIPILIMAGNANSLAALCYIGMAQKAHYFSMRILERITTMICKVIKPAQTLRSLMDGYIGHASSDGLVTLFSQLGEGIINENNSLDRFVYPLSRAHNSLVANEPASHRKLCDFIRPLLK
jgi:pimeloyl-ACP methyl ester carboxylesterase